MKRIQTCNTLSIWERSSREMEEDNQSRFAIFLPDEQPSTADPDWDADSLEEAIDWCKHYFDDREEDDAKEFDPEKPCKDTHECIGDECPYLGTNMCTEDDI